MRGFVRAKWFQKASMVEWSITPRCRRGGFGLRGFESLSAHKMPNPKHVLGFVRFCSSREGFERFLRWVPVRKRGRKIVVRRSSDATASERAPDRSLTSLYEPRSRKFFCDGIRIIRDQIPLGAQMSPASSERGWPVRVTELRSRQSP